MTITGGKRPHHRSPTSVTVPRRDLIAGLQLAFEKGYVRIAQRMTEAGLLIRELKSMPPVAGPAITTMW